MVRRLWGALLLKGVWRFEPIHAVVFWVFLGYMGWFGSPYFMYHFVGAPEPGTAPRYVGTLRVEGELQRTRTGWKPPRYFIRTNQGDKEIHCGYRPYPRECWRFYDFHKRFPEMNYQVGYDGYWGIDYIKYPNDASPKLHENGLPEIINLGRKTSLLQHQTSATLFIFAFLLYAYLVWQSYENSNPKKLLESDASPPKPGPTKEPAELTKLKKEQSLFDQ